MIPLRPRFVLVRPRSPGNVGAVARAMKNFGLSELVLVDPRLHRAHDEPGEEPFFERESKRMAWRAADLLESAKTFPGLPEALAMCGRVYATAPQSYSRMPTLSPEEVARDLAAPSDLPGAVVFGSESSGLTLDELAVCAGVIVIPTDPAYRDLNLAQSAVVMAYQIFRAYHDCRMSAVVGTSGGEGMPKKPATAGHAEVQRAADLLLRLARRADFLKHGGEPVGRELVTLLHRVGLTPREVGLLSSLLRKMGRREEGTGGLGD